jgi:hypothetical protein
MADGQYQFHYTRPGRDPDTDEQELLTDGVTFLGMAGAGMGNLEPATAQQVNEHGEVFVGEQPYMPSRTITVSVQVTGATANEFIQRMAELYEKVTPFTRRNLPLGEHTLGRLKVTRPDGYKRCLDCLCVADPEDSEIKGSPRTAQRHLRFWSPNPSWYDSFMDIVIIDDSIDTWPGGFVSPITSRADISRPGIVCAIERVALRAIVDYQGTMRTWPIFYMVGPARAIVMMLYNEADPPNSEYVELPYELAVGEFFTYDMATGIGKIYHRDGTREESRQMTQDSIRWQLEPGENIVYLAAADLIYYPSMMMGYYARFTGISGGA